MRRLKDVKVGSSCFLLETSINGPSKNWQLVVLVSADEGEYVCTGPDGRRIICDGYEEVR